DGFEDWAYVDVREGTHMFWWLYHTYHPDGMENRPLILWLQGGPGGSGAGYGNFDIIGPLRIDQTERNTTWVKEANILFIDNPVGAGYSYVDDLSHLTTTTQEITDDLLVVFRTFLDTHPEFEQTLFYVFGQSYGGKMAAHFTNQLYREVQEGNFDVNVGGYAMGNAWISPVDSVITWGETLFWMGIVDEPGLADITTEADKCSVAVDEERWHDATTAYRQTQYAVNRRSNYVDFYNILKYRVFSRKEETMKRADVPFAEVFYQQNVGYMQPRDLDDIMNGIVKDKIGIVPEDLVWGAQSDDVFTYQEGDFMKPVIDEMDWSLDNTDMDVIVYQGQLDLICDTKGAMDFVQKMQWDGLDDYNIAERKPFVDPEGQTDTFVKANGNFKFYWNMRAGHAV
ncbi:hypothetical protein CAPTEDRAFT_53367, partial [Capitella teleta]